MTVRWRVRAGFIPLIDAAPLIAAHEIGFAAEEGIDLVLSREMSWATIRDRLAVAHLDVAHALAPLPLAAQLGLSPLSRPLVVPMALGFGGNTVTVSRGMWKEAADAGASPDFDPQKALAALRKVTRSRKEAGRPRPVFAIVHQYSAHHYELAYWLAAGGLLPGRDYELVVLPPPLMPAALSSGGVDGFCAGEPWGSAAAADNVGAIIATKAHIWRSSPDKVLAVCRSWARRGFRTHWSAPSRHLPGGGMVRCSRQSRSTGRYPGAQRSHRFARKSLASESRPGTHRARWHASRCPALADLRRSRGDFSLDQPCPVVSGADGAVGRSRAQR